MSKILKKYPAHDGIPNIEITDDALKHIYIPAMNLSVIPSLSSVHETVIRVPLLLSIQGDGVVLTDEPEHLIKEEFPVIRFFDEIMDELQATTRSLSELSCIQKKINDFKRKYIQEKFFLEENIAFAGLHLQGVGLLLSGNTPIDVFGGVYIDTDSVKIEWATKAFQLDQVENPSFRFKVSDWYQQTRKDTVKKQKIICFDGIETPSTFSENDMSGYQFMPKSIYDDTDNPNAVTMPSFYYQPGSDSIFADSASHYLKEIEEDHTKNRVIEDIDLF